MMKRRAKIAMLAILLFPLIAAGFVTASGKVASAAGDSGRNAAIEKIVSYLRGRKVDLKGDKLKAVVHTVFDESRLRDLDYRLVLAVIKVESNFRPNVVSRKGAAGLFQIKPSTAKCIARDAGVDWNGSQCLHEPDKNIKLGVYHLSKLVEDFKSLPTALHAYNVGSDKVRSLAPDMDEPKTVFIDRVLREYKRNCSRLPDWDELDEASEGE